MIKSILSLLKEEDKTVSRMNALEDTFINHRESETSFLSRQVEATESIRPEYIGWRDAESYKALKEAIRKELFE